MSPAWSSVTWDVARAGGFIAYLLLTASVAIGLAVSLKFRSPNWPRWLTSDLHRFVTLVALVFTGIHTLAVAVDPFIGFTPAEVLVPMVSHYRPLWVALGIIAAYLLIAVYLSEYARPRIGYAWWRRFHYLSFVVFVLATLHGLGNGSDTRTPWAMAVYAGSLFVVGGLLALRLWPEDPRARRHPMVAALTVVGLLAASTWTINGPLQPGWNLIANNGHGSGAAPGVVSAVQGAGGTSGGGASGGQAGTSPFASPFQASMQGTLTQSSDGSSALLDASVGQGAHLRLVLDLAPGDDGGATITGSQLSLSAGTEVCQGQITGVRRDRIAASCSTAAGQAVNLQIQLQVAGDGSVTGSIAGSPA